MTNHHNNLRHQQIFAALRSDFATFFENTIATAANYSDTLQLPRPVATAAATVPAIITSLHTPATFNPKRHKNLVQNPSDLTPNQRALLDLRLFTTIEIRARFPHRDRPHHKKNPRGHHLVSTQNLTHKQTRDFVARTFSDFARSRR